MSVDTYLTPRGQAAARMLRERLGVDAAERWLDELADQHGLVNIEAPLLDQMEQAGIKVEEPGTTVQVVSIGEAINHASVEAQKPAPRVTRAKTKPVARPTDNTTKRGGYAKVYTDVIDTLMPHMPDPVFRAYVYGCRLADDTDSTFWIAYETMARKIGCRSRDSGKVALRLLCKAGVFRRVTRGGPGRATTYQLVPIRELDFDRARQVFGAFLERERKRSQERRERRQHGGGNLPVSEVLVGGNLPADGGGNLTTTQKSTQRPGSANGALPG